jgi:guanylate kinase
MKAKGLLIVVTGPSAVGKGTICRALLQEAPDVRFSVSLTTRKPRPGEGDGVEYFFVSHDEFRARIDAGDVLEWAEVYGNLYGTPRSQVMMATDQGHDVLLDIDMNGARQVRERYADAISVFVVPPSMAELKKRMMARGTEEPEALQRRLNEAPHWIREGLNYDYVIVNDSIPRAVARLKAIIVAEKARTGQHGGELIRTLLKKGELDLDD